MNVTKADVPRTSEKHPGPVEGDGVGLRTWRVWLVVSP